MACQDRKIPRSERYDSAELICIVMKRLNWSSEGIFGGFPRDGFGKFFDKTVFVEFWEIYNQKLCMADEKWKDALSECFS